MGFALYSKEAIFHLIRPGAAVKLSSSMALGGISCRGSSQAWSGMLNVTWPASSILLPVTWSQEVLVRGWHVKLAQGEWFSHR